MALTADFSQEEWFIQSEKNWPLKIGYLADASPSIQEEYSQPIDVVLLTVNDEELKAVLQKFCSDESAQPKLFLAESGLIVYFAKVGRANDPLTVGIIQTEMGSFGQADAVEAAISSLKPRAIISIGVGWGNKKLLGRKGGNLGDVMVSEYIAEFGANNAKVGESNIFHSRSEMPRASKLLCSRVKSASLHWDFKRWVQ